ncbi:MAG: T9SS type A sorting domain-containing protein, partial [Fibrobacterota bacterium]
TKSSGSHTFNAPYSSDWALAVGNFPGDEPPDPPVFTSIEVSGTGSQVLIGETMQFSASALDQYGSAMDPQPSISWSVSGNGVIDQNGLFTAGQTEGTATITATSGSIEGTASVDVVTEILDVSVSLVNYSGSNTAPTVVENGFTEGCDQVNDRSGAQWTSIPSELSGSTYLLTARDDKSLSGALYTVNISQTCSVYALIEVDDAPSPDWLVSDGWSSTSMSLLGDGANYSVYLKVFDAGDISLKVQSGSSSEGTGYVFGGTGGTSSDPGDDPGDDPGTCEGDSVIFDVDLTQGNSGGGTVIGGIWSGGWKTTSSNGQRVVYDAGYNIANGYAEVTFTIDEDPFQFDTKTNYFGIFEASGLDHYNAGDKAYCRSGRTKYAFSRIKAYHKAFDTQEWEHNVGSTSDWNADGSTVYTIRLTWDNGVVTYSGPGGPASYTNSEFNAIRYIFIGSGNSYGKNLKGQCFKSIRIVDFDKGGCSTVEAESVPETEETSIRISPTPFNPSTEIRISGVNPAERISVNIYDLSGKKLETLGENASFGKASYIFKWNAANMPSGTYIVSAVVGNKSFRKRIVLIK